LPAELADWLKALMMDFAARVDSPTRTDALRLKDWLHLSLAYGFSPASAVPLETLVHRDVLPFERPFRRAPARQPH
jgi:ubiquitin-associated SH3 domain-containing protein